MESESLLPHSQQHLSLFWARLIQFTPSHFLNIYFNIILPSIPESSKWALSLSFPTKTVYAPFLNLVCATCSNHLILLGLITRIVFGKVLYVNMILK